jgi:hypothetical protein
MAINARKTRPIDALEDVGVKTLKYLYDFDDGWEHTIKIQRLIDRLKRASPSQKPTLSGNSMAQNPRPRECSARIIVSTATSLCLQDERWHPHSE